MGELTLTRLDATAVSAGRGQALRGWWAWVAARTAAGVSVVLAVSVIVFVTSQALPSDPARVALGPQASAETVATLRERLGLDRPLLDQYLSWLGGLLRGDLGTSINSGQPVSAMLSGRIANSAALVVLAALVAVPAAVGLGVLLARTRHRVADAAAGVVLIGLLAAPDFALGAVLIVVLATNVLPILPATSVIDPNTALLGQLPLLVLPALTLALGICAHLTRLIRSSMLEQLASDHVAAARLRGIPERRVLLRHALPNALIPGIQGLALTIGVLIGGTVAVESAFAFPGLGSALDTAVHQRDFPVIQSEVVLIAAAVVVITLVADLATTMLSPRQRIEVEGR